MNLFKMLDKLLNTYNDEYDIIGEINKKIDEYEGLHKDEIIHNKKNDGTIEDIMKLAIDNIEKRSKEKDEHIICYAIEKKLPVVACFLLQRFGYDQIEYKDYNKLVLQKSVSSENSDLQTIKSSIESYLSSFRLEKYWEEVARDNCNKENEAQINLR